MNLFVKMALIFDRIGFLSCQPLEQKYRLQGFKHYVSVPLDGVITEDGGEECDQIISKTWSRDVRSQSLSVVLKGKIHKLLPALKIEKGLKPHRICEAFNVVEQLFLKKMKNAFGEDPESVHLDILERYPSRLAHNEFFRPLHETGFKPNYK